MKRKNPKLSALLKFSHPDLIDRFSYDYGLSRPTVETIFQDLMRYLWIADRLQSQSLHRRKSQLLGSLVIIDSWLIIDEMWHSFLLFNKDYEEFCLKHFGHILRHAPDTTRTSVLQKRSKAINYEAYVDLIYDNFGATVANRWFVEYRRKYTKARILRLQLKALKR